MNPSQTTGRLDRLARNVAVRAAEIASEVERLKETARGLRAIADANERQAEIVGVVTAASLLRMTDAREAPAIKALIALADSLGVEPGQPTKGGGAV